MQADCVANDSRGLLADTMVDYVHLIWSGDSFGSGAEQVARIIQS